VKVSQNEEGKIKKAENPEKFKHGPTKMPQLEASRAEGPAQKKTQGDCRELTMGAKKKQVVFKKGKRPPDLVRSWRKVVGPSRGGGTRVNLKNKAVAD